MVQCSMVSQRFMGFNICPGNIVSKCFRLFLRYIRFHIWIKKHFQFDDTVSRIQL